MKAWRIAAGAQIEGLKFADEKPRALGAHDVRVRAAAASLNFRDLMIINGWYPLVGKEPIIPGSDASGEVIEAGSAVTRFRVGDRVATSFFPDWIEGRPSRAKLATALGGGSPGVLAQELVLDENALVKSPAHLDAAQAATLSCAGVTAWNALFVGGQIKPGDTVVLLGTGGVSIWALQLAKAAGARVIITSSSDEKLARARSLGADDTVNYRTTPDWDNEVLRLTGGVAAGHLCRQPADARGPGALRRGCGHPPGRRQHLSLRGTAAGLPSLRGRQALRQGRRQHRALTVALRPGPPAAHPA